MRFRFLFFFFSSRRRHTRSLCDWSSDVCSSDLSLCAETVVQMSASTMRAFVLTGPGHGAVYEVPVPVAAAGEVVVTVDRAGVCGTDVELFTGELAYLQTGHSSYPLRPGHEWCGRVTAVGDGVDPAWLGRRVMGDTMLGDQGCRRCRRGGE